MKNLSISRVASAGLAILFSLAIAGCGGGGASIGSGGGSIGGGVPGADPNPPVQVNPGPIAASVVLSSDNGVIQSAGVAGSEATIKALVKDANNNVVAGVKVAFSADSGDVTVIDPVSDAKGVVLATLGVGGDPTTRVITVTAQAAGAAPKTMPINVVGTTLKISANSGVNVGSVSDISVTLKDSAGAPIKGKTITFKQTTANPLVVKSGGAAVTDVSGQLVLSYTASSGTTDTITVSALGETAAASFKINSSNFVVKAVDVNGALLSQANINSCQRVSVQYSIAGAAQSGSVSLSNSLGAIFNDSACSVALTTSLLLDGTGSTTGYVKASTPGVATLNAALVGAVGTNSQGTIEFVAPLTVSATISLQSSPAVIGTNAGGSNAQQSTLRAVVRDGTGQNNLVKGAQVTFSILSDPSGGSLQQPSVGTTASDGSVSVVYIAGASSTALNGVQIRAQIQGASTATATTTLTVSKQSLFISAGTGNTILTPTAATYQVDYVVFVTDVSGNAVAGADVVAAVRPDTYSKGLLAPPVFGNNMWHKAAPIFTCLNEDVNLNGTLDAIPTLDINGLLHLTEDFNGNARLDPGIPVTVTSSGKTDTTGSATISLAYPRDRALWTSVEMTITGSVAGTEARYKTTFVLQGAAADYNDAGKAPPGQVSPYGVGNDTNECRQVL